MKITIRNLQKKALIHPKKIKKIALNTLSLEGIKNSGEIAIYFVSDKEIRKLNLKYLDRDAPTDVIAFDLSEPAISDNIFADIFISTDTALVNAGTYKTSLSQELCLYVIHGLLHLLGYDDKRLRQRQMMDKKANHILTTLWGRSPRCHPKHLEPV
ncbi:MAG: rRNA maturation RNase YbeY [Candidatus Omnitrophica bacterium]|nr:rRNA maturation RNase YbeY [Candidatus Omnitrophota bacterium]